VPAVTSVTASLICRDAATAARLRIWLLPRKQYPGIPLIDDRADPQADPTVSPIQLLEGQEYRYEWEFDRLPLAGVITDPEDIFQPDLESGVRGRLRPGLATGLVKVVLRSGEGIIGELELEVRSHKLSYRSEYRWMLRDIADQMTELVMMKFAASSTSFEQDPTRDAITLYQRFEFLRSLLADESMQVALQEIRRRPHVAWEEQHELVRAGELVKATANTVRNMSKQGRRIPWPNGPIPSLPAQLVRTRTEATHDTTPNRFVRFALERWRQVVSDIQASLDSGDLVARSRGVREIAQVLEQLDAVLHDELFKDIGQLTHFPADNQVLHRREGYREVFRAYLEFELAARLSWKRDETTHQGRQRSVAQLYEFWAFLRLADLIAELSGTSFDVSSVLEVNERGLTVGLRSGEQKVLAGTVQRHGRTLSIEFCFNRTFNKPGGSWTLPMRPDYSLLIKPSDVEAAIFEPVILHFDAKYRVNAFKELFGQTDLSNPEQIDENNGWKRSGAKHSDLLKMHAYRDAIRRSAGAYVLYPGDDSPESTPTFQEYRELLPGLGAFVFRPSPIGEPVGSAALREFLDAVLDHVAQRFSRHERSRHWLQESYGRDSMAPDHTTLFPLGTPQDKTTVLLGYVKNAEHWHWIQKRLAYNVRTEERRGGVAANAELLYSQLVLLYGPTIDLVALARIVSGPERVSRVAMQATGYPEARSDYLCVLLSDIRTEAVLSGVVASEVDRVAVSRTGVVGRPVSVLWGELKAELAIETGSLNRSQPSL
jgi:predicted component of viral defense system (DUF524 family)